MQLGNGPELLGVVECDALLVVAGAHLEVAGQPVEDPEAEPDPHLGGGALAAAAAAAAAGEHVEAQHEGVRQPLTVLTRPKSGGIKNQEFEICGFAISMFQVKSQVTETESRNLISSLVSSNLT